MVEEDGSNTGLTPLSRRWFLKGALASAFVGGTWIATQSAPSENGSMDSNHVVPTSSSRPLESKGNRTINVPGDFDSLQTALYQVPYFLRHEWIIRVREPVSEDIIVPGYVGSNLGYDGVANHLQIIGDRDEPVALDSLLIGGTQGTADPLVRGFKIQGQVPHVDEPFGIVVMGCQEVALDRIHFSKNVYGGIVAYNSNVVVKESHFGDNNLHYGVMVKRGGYLTLNRCFGHLTGFVFVLNGGMVVVKNSKDDLAAQKSRIQHRGGGIVIDGDSQRTYLPHPVEIYK